MLYAGTKKSINFYNYIAGFIKSFVTNTSVILIIGLLLSRVAYSQTTGKEHILLGGGIFAYQGDLCNSFSCNEINPGFSVGYHLQESDQYILRGVFSYFKLSQQQDQNATRNLSFSSNVFQLKGEYLFFPIARKGEGLHPFLQGGLAMNSFNSKADYLGQSYFLQPLQTEGEAYDRLALSTNFGLGLNFHTNKFDVFIEANYSFFFHDRIDDVSKNYVNNSSLIGIAADLADRTFESGNTPSTSVDGEHWDEGQLRGNDNGSDRFWSISLNFNIPLYNTNLHCPSDFWK